jgi:hypothetical protein
MQVHQARVLAFFDSVLYMQIIPRASPSVPTAVLEVSQEEEA